MTKIKLVPVQLGTNRIVTNVVAHTSQKVDNILFTKHGKCMQTQPLKLDFIQNSAPCEYILRFVDIITGNKITSKAT